MTGKQQAESLVKEMSQVRDKLFQIKKKYTSWFIHKTIKNIFEGTLKYRETKKYTGSWLGYDMYSWRSNDEPIQLINETIKNIIMKYHTGTYHLTTGMVSFCRHGKVCKYMLDDWNSEAIFFIDHDNIELYIYIKIKLKNRWYRYKLTENNITYEQIKPPTFRY